MHIPWLETDTPLPPPESAQKTGTELAGLVAAGGGLSVVRLQEAYRQGIFPWFSDGQPILWWSPDPRMVLDTEKFKLHPSLRKTLHKFIDKPDSEIRIDSAFGEVIRQCAHSKRKGQSGTWIVPEMIEAYETLHAAGFAHSVETWVKGELVGGLYAVCLGSAVFGESMFTHQTDASKIALAALIAFCRHHNLPWIDCQQNTKHLASLGAQVMSREKFLTLLRQASPHEVYDWVFKPSYWNALLPHRSIT